MFFSCSTQTFGQNQESRMEWTLTPYRWTHYNIRQPPPPHFFSKQPFLSRICGRIVQILDLNTSGAHAIKNILSQAFMNCLINDLTCTVVSRAFAMRSSSTTRLSESQCWPTLSNWKTGHHHLCQLTPNHCQSEYLEHLPEFYCFWGKCWEQYLKNSPKSHADNIYPNGHVQCAPTNPIHCGCVWPISLWIMTQNYK